MNGKILLIGYMGVGKSELAQALSRELGMPHQDLDAYIEEKAGGSIRKIFEEEGEEVFRKRESACLKELLDRPAPLVIACGGGTPCSEKNLRMMKEADALIVHLRATPSTILARSGKEADERPLLMEKDEKAVEAHLQERMPFYEEADLSLDTEEGTPEELAKELRAYYER